MNINYNEKIDFTSEGNNNISLLTLNSLLNVVDEIVEIDGFYDNRDNHLFISPFKEGSFTFKILTDIAIGLAENLVFPLLVSYFDGLRKVHKAKGKIRIMQRRDGLYDLIDYNGLAFDVVTHKQLIHLLNPKLAKDISKFATNSILDDRGDLNITNDYTGEIYTITKKDLIKFRNNYDLDTIELQESLYEGLFTIKTFGFEDSNWLLIPHNEIPPLNKSNQIYSKLSSDPSIVSLFRKRYKLEGNSYLINSVIRLKLLIQYEYDHFTKEVRGTPKYTMIDFLDENNFTQLSLF